MKLSFCSLALFLLCACTHEEVVHTAARAVASSQAPSEVEGIWSLQGSSSVRGPYTGELELKRGSDGTYNVVRVVNYISFYFEGLRVQEIWTGKAVPNKEGLVISYELADSGFVTELSGVKRKAASFRTKTTVNEFFRLNVKDFLEASFTDKTSATFQEWIATKRPLEAQSIWTNQRTKISATGSKNLPAPLAALLKSTKAQLNFDKDAFVQSFAKRTEFKNGQAYIVFDPTDYDFYQKNNDKIRVVGRSIDSISLVEALLRRNAYVYTLQQKANIFEKNLLGRHVNEQGLVSSADVDEKGLLKFAPNNEDSGFLTGMYLASQCMRYQHTKDPEALANVKKFLPAFLNAIDNTGTQGKNFQSAAEHALVWVGLTLPKSEASLWAQLRDKSSQMSQKNPERATSLATASLLNQDMSSVEKIKDLYLIKLKQNKFENFYWKGSANWNLIFVQALESMTDIMLTEALEMKDTKEDLQKQLLDRWVLYAPTQRHLLSFAAYGFSFNKGVRSESFRSESSDEKIKAAVTSAVWGLREMPQPRPFFDLSYDHSLSTDWSLSPVPRGFWNFKKGTKPPLETFYQGLYEYPLFEDKSFYSSFVWREDAFTYKGSSSKGIERPGVDYLYAYWLAQYVSVLVGE